MEFSSDKDMKAQMSVQMKHINTTTTFYISKLYIKGTVCRLPLLMVYDCSLNMFVNQLSYNLTVFFVLNILIVLVGKQFFLSVLTLARGCI